MKLVWIFILALGCQNTYSSNRLVNDQFCGITTGGREECNWDCETSLCLPFPNFPVTLYSNLECLRCGITKQNKDNCQV